MAHINPVAVIRAMESGRIVVAVCADPPVQKAARQFGHDVNQAVRSGADLAGEIAHSVRRAS